MKEEKRKREEEGNGVGGRRKEGGVKRIEREGEFHKFSWFPFVEYRGN